MEGIRHTMPIKRIHPDLDAYIKQIQQAHFNMFQAELSYLQATRIAAEKMKTSCAEVFGKNAKKK